MESLPTWFLPKKMLHNWSHTTPLDILDHLRACYQRWYCMIFWSFCQLPLYDDPQIFCWVNLHASQARVLPKTMVTHNWTNTFDSWTHDAWESWICRGGPLNVGWNCETTHSGQIIATSYDLGPPKRWFCKGNPVISRKSRLVKYDSIWPDSWFSLVGHLVERLLWISCRDVVCQHKWHVGWRSKHYIQHMMSSTPMFWPLWPRRGYFLQKRD